MYCEFEQASAAKDAPFSVTRVTWSPDGTFCGKCLFLVYTMSYKVHKKMMFEIFFFFNFLLQELHFPSI